MSKKCVDLLLLEENNKKHYAFIKDFKRFMYNRTLHVGRKHFCRYCLQASSTEEILRCQINGGFKINTNQRIKMPKRDEYVKCKNYERKIKSTFMIYAHFESMKYWKAKSKLVLYKKISKT